MVHTVPSVVPAIVSRSCSIGCDEVTRVTGAGVSVKIQKYRQT